MREFKEHSDTSMPQFVRFPVENPDDFETFAAERLALNSEARFPAEWKKQVAAGGLKGVAGGASIADVSDTTEATDENPRLCWADRWGGFFGSLRNMLGLENLCCAFYDNPAWVERMMEERADAIIEITSKVFEHTTFDVFWYWEDMAYNHASLIDPNMYRRFASKHYRRVNDWLRGKGVRHIGLDSDGDIRELIPVWMDSGIDMLWPFEAQSNMDVVEVRKQYGHDLIIMGGIDKRKLAAGGDAMRKEVDRVMPLVEDGGYIPEADHSIPPDVTWSGFIEYVEYLKARLGRG
jgi:uroporphyrinogen decarboxylase